MTKTPHYKNYSFIHQMLKMSSLATDAQRKVAPDTNVRNAIQSTDIANIQNKIKTIKNTNLTNQQQRLKLSIYFENELWHIKYVYLCT